jgi:hypothetical protein
MINTVYGQRNTKKKNERKKKEHTRTFLKSRVRLLINMTTKRIATLE